MYSKEFLLHRHKYFDVIQTSTKVDNAEKSIAVIHDRLTLIRTICLPGHVKDKD